MEHIAEIEKIVTIDDLPSVNTCSAFEKVNRERKISPEQFILNEVLIFYLPTQPNELKMILPRDEDLTNNELT